LAFFVYYFFIFGNTGKFNIEVTLIVIWVYGACGVIVE